MLSYFSLTPEMYLMLYLLCPIWVQRDSHTVVLGTGQLVDPACESPLGVMSH